MTQNNDSCGTNACESLSREPLVGSAQPITNTVFHIEKMDCPSEERQIRQRLERILKRLQASGEVKPHVTVDDWIKEGDDGAHS